jgi:hypothetical protein
MRALFILSFLLTCLASPAIGQPDLDRSSLTVPVQFGAEELSFDVIQADEFVFQIALQRSQDDVQRFPVISIEEYVGFQCSVNKIALVDRIFNLNDRTYTESYEARVSWRAGGDVSGCYLTFTDPYKGDSARVHLYMIFE